MEEAKDGSDHTAAAAEKMGITAAMGAKSAGRMRCRRAVVVTG